MLTISHLLKADADDDGGGHGERHDQAPGEVSHSIANQSWHHKTSTIEASLYPPRLTTARALPTRPLGKNRARVSLQG